MKKTAILEEEYNLWLQKEGRLLTEEWFKLITF